MRFGRAGVRLAVLAGVLLAGALAWPEIERLSGGQLGGRQLGSGRGGNPLSWLLGRGGPVDQGGGRSGQLPSASAGNRLPASGPGQALPPNLGSGEYRPLNLRALSQAVPVFTYHDIIRSRRQKGAVWFDCTVAEFEDQMRFLADQGAQVVTLAQLQTHLTQGTPLPPRAVVLTFDDSYQGFFDLAYPVLRRYGYPAAMFVHTDYVGVQTGDHPKMTWAELQQLDREGLVTIGAHTRSHPADLATLSVAQQDEELRGSKAVLERQLGHRVNFQSYANGKGDAVTFERARLAGYTLGFLEFWGPVEQSPGIMQLNRYIHLQMPRGWNEAYGKDALPTAAVLPLTRTQPLESTERLVAGVRLRWQSGGRLEAGGTHPAAPLRLDLTTRLSGPDGAQQTVEPLLLPGGPFTPPSLDAAGQDALQGRPLLLWSGSQLAVLPYAAPLMNDEAALRAYLPGLQGAALGSMWLVHGGAALSSTALGAHPAAGWLRARRRSFLGLDAAGVPVLGVSDGPVSVPRLATALAALGMREAVMLDAGLPLAAGSPPTGDAPAAAVSLGSSP